MSGDEDGDVESTVVIRARGPVFVDGTGKRRRRVKITAYAAASVCAVYMGVVAVSLVAHQETSLVPLPSGGDAVAGGTPETAGILDGQPPGAPTLTTPPKPVALGDVVSRAMAPVSPAAVVSSPSPPTTTTTTSAAPTTTRSPRTTSTRTRITRTSEAPPPTQPSEPQVPGNTGTGGG